MPPTAATTDTPMSASSSARSAFRTLDRFRGGSNGLLHPRLTETRGKELIESIARAEHMRHSDVFSSVNRFDEFLAPSFRQARVSKAFRSA